MIMINLTKDVNRLDAKSIAELTGTDELCAAILISRGIADMNTAKRFLYGALKDLHSPFEYSGMKEAVAEIRTAIEIGKKIVFYGDYDCDGIGAVSILLRAFRDKGIKADYYIPVRADEGYGLNIDAIDKIISEFNTGLLVTVDCGINAFKEIEYAKQNDVSVIITDHHRIEDKLPSCTIVNPCLNPKLTQLCGAGVAFTLVRALFGEEFAYNYLDICALSTVADMVPLVDDNRIIVKFGLEQLRRGKGKVGISELMVNAGINFKKVNSYDIAFKLAPRLNASGRLSEAHLSVKLLTTDDKTDARFIAEELSAQNTERQAIGNAIIADAMEKLKTYDFGKYRVIILYNADWQEGVNGIACARLVEYFNLPALLFTKNSDGILKGSARSITGVNIYEALSTQKHLTERFGGHAMAAGLSIREENLELFREGLNEELKKLDCSVFERKNHFDADFPIENATYDVFKNIRLLEPFGFKNPAPIFRDSNPNLKFKRIGNSLHLKAKTKYCEVVCFGKGELIPAFESSKNRNILYTLERNSFKGSENDQIKIKTLNFQQFEISEDILNYRFLDFSVKIKGKEDFSLKNKSTEFGFELHVFFSGNEFKRYCENNPKTTKLYASCDNFLFADTAVLSPNIDFPFSYYNRIFLHGEVTDSIRDYFIKAGADILSGSRMILPNFDLDAMRTVYKIMRKHFFRECYKFQDIEKLYAELRFKELQTPYEEFLLYFYILFDVELLKILNGDILIINNKKTELNESALYRYINGNRA